MGDGGCLMVDGRCGSFLAPRSSLPATKKGRREDAKGAKEQPMKDGGCLMEAGVAELPPFNLPIQESMK